MVEQNVIESNTFSYFEIKVLTLKFLVQNSRILHKKIPGSLKESSDLFDVAFGSGFFVRNPNPECNCCI